MRRVFSRNQEKDPSTGKDGDELNQGSSSQGSKTNSTRSSGQSPEVAVHNDCNTRYRKTMEDSHSIIKDFMGIPGCVYLAIFDGHAGAQCSLLCANTMHELVSQAYEKTGDMAEGLSLAFEEMDTRIEQHGIMNSGCTAVVAVIGSINKDGKLMPKNSDDTKQALWVANVGDARAVLCRGQQALRLSYDHRGSDVNEQRRVTNAGGIVMNSRVNGVLAVTRSLGDLYMKDYVVGSPYTTETDLTEEDSALILACDGLWDVCTDEEAANIVQACDSADQASEKLLVHSLDSFTTDNVTVMVVKL